jgi:hypothetical protein
MYSIIMGVCMAYNHPPLMKSYVMIENAVYLAQGREVRQKFTARILRSKKEGGAIIINFKGDCVRRDISCIFMCRPKANVL